MVHPTNDPDESKTLSADNLVTLTATITDKDGDSASATQTIGQNLVFQDDGPTISAPTAILSLTVDETVLATNATAAFAAAFTSSYRRPMAPARSPMRWALSRVRRDFSTRRPGRR